MQCFNQIGDHKLNTYLNLYMNIFSNLSIVTVIKTLKTTYKIVAELSWYILKKFSLVRSPKYVISSKVVNTTDWDKSSWDLFFRYFIGDHTHERKKCRFWHFGILASLCSLGNKGSQVFASLAFGHSYYSFHHPVIVISQKVHWLLWSQSTQLKIQFKCL